VTALAFAGVASGACRLPSGMIWSHVAGAGLLGGIGFTMSIFITNLAFAGNAEMESASKLTVLISPLIAGIAGYTWLRLVSGRGVPVPSGDRT